MAITKPDVGDTDWDDVGTALVAGVNHYLSPTVTLTDASTVAINAAAGRHHKVTVAGNRTIGKPSGGADGQPLTITIVQDATGGRAWALHADYRLPPGLAVTPSASANARDKLAVQYDAGADKWDVLAFLRGDGDAASPSSGNPFATFLEPSGGDDTTLITTAIADAVTDSVTRGDRYAEVVFAPGVYLISGTPTVGGGTQGSALIPLPVISHDVQKVTLVLRGVVDASALYHWEQDPSEIQQSGVVFKTSYVGTETVLNGREISVVGGPTRQFGYGSAGPLFSNMLVVIDGITIVVPGNPRVAGFDFRGVAQANVVTASYLAQHTGTGAPEIPDPTWGFGLAMPESNNNDNCNIGLFSAQGAVNGCQFYEHVYADSLRLIRCYNGIVFAADTGFPHHNLLGYVSCEASHRAVANVGFAKVTIACLNVELPDGEIVRDVDNQMWGTVVVSHNGAESTILAKLNGDGVAGAGNLRIIHENTPTGSATAPSVPSSTTALRNPFWRDAAVVVAGGTVTAIAVDGQTTGLTAGTVFVPAGRTIALTYSSAPTWTWTLL